VVLRTASSTVCQDKLPQTKIRFQTFIIKIYYFLLHKYIKKIKKFSTKNTFDKFNMKTVYFAGIITYR
jgi:hypothetical protein